MKARTKARVKRIAAELRAMRRSISMLGNAVRRLGPVLRTIASTNGHPVAGSGRRKPRLSSKHRAALKLQGRYMGFIRQLGPRQKARVRAIRAQQGVEAAIKRARELARG